MNAETLERLPLRGARLVETEGSVPGAAAELERQAGVRYAEPNFIHRVLAAPNDPGFAQQWALNNTGQAVNGVFGSPDADIDVVQAWDLNVGSESVIVAIVDLGVAWGHPDLAPNIYTNPGETPGNDIDDDGNGETDDFRGWDFFDDDDNPPRGAPPTALGSRAPRVPRATTRSASAV